MRRTRPTLCQRLGATVIRWSARSELRRLQEVHREVAAAVYLSKRRRAELRPYYEDYVAVVSSPDMAISLELGSVLLELCETIRPFRVADLGSGFSSYVLRRYVVASAAETDVWSVDDSEEWLERTRRYLAGHDLPTDQCVTWQAFRERALPGTFDLLLHDLGSMDTRLESLPTALALCRPGGLTLLDDFHKASYARAARELLGAKGLTSFSLAAKATDGFGRFPLLVLTDAQKRTYPFQGHG